MISKYEVLEEEKERLRIKAEEKLAQERRKLEEALREAQEAADAEAEAGRKKVEAAIVPVVNDINEDKKKEEKPIFILRDNEEKQIPDPVPTNLKSHHHHHNPNIQSILMVEKGKVDGYKQQTLSPSLARVSLSEFETDTENPFDSIELKSMNDKAELANIWSKVLQEQQNQNHVSNSKLPASPTPSNNSPTVTATNQNQAATNNVLINGRQVAPSPPIAVTTSSAGSNTFTSLHFPFLSNYAQTNATKNREYERGLERDYYQHYHQQQSLSHPQLSFPNQQNTSHSQLHLHQQQQQQQISSATGPPLVGPQLIGGFNSAGILSTMVPHHQPSITSTSPSMSNYPNILYPNSTNKYNNTTNLQ